MKFEFERLIQIEHLEQNSIESNLQEKRRGGIELQQNREYYEHNFLFLFNLNLKVSRPRHS